MMKPTFLLALVITFLGFTCLGAKNTIIAFRDTTSYSHGLVLLEDPDYPVNASADRRWIVIAYLSTDDAINPLSESKLPTGDDIVNPFVTNKEGHIAGQLANGLIFGPGEFNFPLIIGGSVVTPDHFGKKLYIRIFNAPTLDGATKYMEFDGLIDVKEEVNPIIIDVHPNYGWKHDPVWRWIKSPLEECREDTNQD